MQALLFALSFINLMLVRSETISCKVVPFQTKDGLTGTCCVIFSKENQNFPKEEVAQIIANDQQIPASIPQEQSNNVVTTPAVPATTPSPADEGSVVFMDGNRRAYNDPKEWKPKGKNVTIETKNAFDVPNGCPMGYKKDHSGVCTQPF